MTRSRILSETRPGAIILVHDIHASSIDAMPGTLDGLLARGSRFVTVSQARTGSLRAEPPERLLWLRRRTAYPKF